jgi:hypothetical protein
MKPLFLLAIAFASFVGCSTQAVVDEVAGVREQIYLRYFRETRASDRFVYFVAESDPFIAVLKKSSGLGYIEPSSAARYDEARDEMLDVKTGRAGIRMKILDIVVHGTTASAKFVYTATSIAAGGYTVQLIKEDGVWKIADWKKDWVS